MTQIANRLSLFISLFIIKAALKEVKFKTKFNVSQRLKSQVHLTSRYEKQRDLCFCTVKNPESSRVRATPSDKRIMFRTEYRPAPF